MTLLLGAVGWGLLTFGAITHVWHHGRLRRLLAMHFDNEQPLAFVLTAAEVALAVGIPAAYLAEVSALIWIGGAATLLALGFVVWIGRLLLTKSELPCACSFADTPTSYWSLGRALCTTLAAFFMFLGPEGTEASASIATFAVGLAVAGAIFVLPEAIEWPATSKAMLRRIDAHGSGDRAGATR